MNAYTGFDASALATPGLAILTDRQQITGRNSDIERLLYAKLVSHGVVGQSAHQAQKKFPFYLVDLFGQEL
nr:hypothetical protein [[Pseudomonas] sp. BICA1-14]